MSHRLVVIGLVAFVGCNSPAKVIAKYKADVTARAADLTAIAAMLDAPGGTSDSVHLVPPANFEHDADGQNASVIEADDLRGVLANEYVKTVGVGEYHQFGDAIEYAKDGTDEYGRDPTDAKSVEVPMRRLANLSYLIVMTTKTFAAPKEIDTRSFEKGGYSGTALLFDVRGHQLLGRWPVSAESSARVGGLGGIEAGVFVGGDLTKNVQTEIAKIVRDHVPRSVPPSAYLLR